jgi:hypothetical protein
MLQAHAGALVDEHEGLLDELVGRGDELLALLLRLLELVRVTRTVILPLQRLAEIPAQLIASPQKLNV